MKPGETRIADVSRKLAEAGLEVTPREHTRLSDFLSLLQRWNQIHNLTAIRSPAEMIDRHLVESLALQPLLRGRRVADVGTGAGLPGIPLSIVEPERQFTLIESRAKRVRFLRHVTCTLELHNVTIEHCRVEDLPSAEPFDTVLARAVAAVPALPGMIGHLLGLRGIVLVVTGDRGAEEFQMPRGFAVQRLQGGTVKLVRGAVILVKRVKAEET